MKKNDKAVVASPEPSPTALSSSPPAELQYRITIYCTLAQINVVENFTEAGLDTFLQDVLKVGYSDNKPGRTVIYPAHTISKIEVTVQP